jgi:hypothetical protein
MIPYFQKYLAISSKLHNMKWPIYDHFLVRSGELLLAFDIINNWDAELKEMNKDKIREPFHYPNTFLLLLGYAKVYFHLPYRQTEEGITQGDMLMENFLYLSLITLR